MVTVVINRIDNDSYFDGFCPNGRPQWVKKQENAKSYIESEMNKVITDHQTLTKLGYKVKVTIKK